MEERSEECTLLGQTRKRDSLACDTSVMVMTDELLRNYDPQVKER